MLKQQSDNKQSLRTPFLTKRSGMGFESSLVVDRYNSRLKLPCYEGDLTLAALDLYKAAEEYGVGKIIVYTTVADSSWLRSAGFIEEGQIPGFFRGLDACCLVAYPDPGRALPRDSVRADMIIRDVAMLKPRDRGDISSFVLHRANMEDAAMLARFYADIFGDDYPTPISEQSYLENAMQTGTVFWLATAGGRLAAAASLETDKKNNNAEVTDCAVQAEFRGMGLMGVLVEQLEAHAAKEGIDCLYSLARALLPGINALLFTAGYNFSGRLINNCYICGELEDMNIWAKNNKL